MRFGGCRERCGPAAQRERPAAKWSLMRSLASVSSQFVAWIALLRCAGVLFAVARQGLRLKRTTVTKWGWTETLAAPEPFIMMAFAYFLITRSHLHAGEPILHAAVAIVGGVLAAVGISIWLWGFATIPSLSSGHYVLARQDLITSGAFGFVRHPIYLGVFVLWLALAAASASIVTLAVTIVYVVPIYIFYIRSEERMMLDHFGASYREYQGRTGMVFPRHRRHRSDRGEP